MGDAGKTKDDEQYELRAKEIDWLEIDDQVVALDIQQSVYLATNETGKVLWQALAGGATIRGLTDTLVDTYGIDEATALRDVSAFLEMLRDRGLLSNP